MPEDTIPTIVAKLERGDIEVPELQRDFVWKIPQIQTLADSIYRSYPIGILTLFPPPPELGGRGGIYWVLDGQQRLFSLALIVKGSIELREGQAKQLRVWFNPKTEKFVCKKLGITPRGEKWVEVPNLYRIKNRSELEKYSLSLKNIAPEEREKIHVLWETLRNYKIPYHHVDPSAELDTLAEIFVRTNYAGTRVRGVDISSTMIAVSKAGTAKELRDFVRGLSGDWKEIDYAIPIKTFITHLTDGKVKLASRVLDQSSKLKVTLKKKESEIPQLVDITKKSIKEAITLLEQDWLKIYTPNHGFLPYDN